MITWQEVFHRGLCPLLSTSTLKALRNALEMDDSRIIQRETVVPEPCEAFPGASPEGACLIGFCGWIEGDLSRTTDVEAFFLAACNRIERTYCSSVASSVLIGFFDATERSEAFRLLLVEVERALADRQETEEPALVLIAE